MRRRFAPAALLLLLAAGVAPALASPLALSWGAISEPAVEGTMAPGRVAEHLEFLQSHGWRAVGLGELDGGGGLPARAVLVSFDDPASAARYVVPLLELYRMKAVVTVGAEQGRDPALEPALAVLASSPWIELAPRVERAPGAPENGDPVHCGTLAAAGEEPALSALRAALAMQVEGLRRVSGIAPTAVAWAPGAWSGATEAVAASLGLTVNLPTFTTMPPPLAPPRVARFAMPSWAGVWAVAQAAVRWDPEQHPVRFVEVEAAWLCAGGDPQARLQRIVAVVRRLGLNGVRLLPGDGTGAWFPTTAAPVRGDVVGPLARALHAAGVPWIAVDVPSTGDPGRDVALGSDLARTVDLDVAILPADAREGDRLGEAIRYVRPAARLGWRGEGAPRERAFRLAPFAPGLGAASGATVVASTVARADREATDLAIAGREWVGLPVELAELGLRGSLRSLAAFALPAAGKPTRP